MANKKMVYVPRNWKVSYVDASGYEHKDMVIRANSEYRITVGEKSYNVSISGIRTEEDKIYILAKVILRSGRINVMEKTKELRFDVDSVTDITPIVSKYIKTKSRENTAEINTFTFAFDSEKFSSKYRITVAAGEFVALAIKDIEDSNKKTRSLYGHVIDVTEDSIKFSRYVSNHGVRDVYEMDIPLNTLLGVYRYELELSDAEIPAGDVEAYGEESAAELGSTEA